MAEGWTRALKSDLIDVASAGIETHGVNPYAVRVMAEAGVDVSAQRSQLLDEFLDLPFDYVVTVCDHARESCPRFPGSATVLHHAFDDPPKLAPENASEEERLNAFRRVRDEIRVFVESLPAALEEPR